MALPLTPPYAPMEAASVDELPYGEEWQYEPKWDGFRCLVFRDGAAVQLQSKAGQPLARYFPEIVSAVVALESPSFILDAEIVIPTADGGLSFDALLQRLHPAASRVQKLSRETPALLVVFDLLSAPKQKELYLKPLRERRAALEEFAARHFHDRNRFRLSPVAREAVQAAQWLADAGGACDGVMAKRLDLAYASGERTGMQKIKQYRSADCVVGGFRYGSAAKVVGSLLLGLYDDAGLLNHVGFCSGLKAAEKPTLTRKLEKLQQAPGFSGRAPGGPSRWATERSTEWVPLQAKLVVEVTYDHFSGDRFRHGTKLIRWRPDKAPELCRQDQLQQKASMRLLG